jgi:putative ABC transport system permease protein
MSGLMQDIGFAVRVIRKRPGASAVIVLTLALGISVNTTFFTFFNGMILHPLPFEDPERLVSIRESQPKLGKSRQPISAPNFRDWQEENHVFEGMEPFVDRNFNLHTEDNPERVQGTSVSHTLFPLLGIEPILGRNFRQEEDRPGGPRVALISHAVWQKRFESDPAVVGKTILLDDRVHEVVGVMPPGFRFQNFSEVWTPLALDPNDGQRDRRWLAAIARLAPEVTVGQAQAEMTLIGERLEARYPESNTGWNVRVRALRDAWLPPVTQFSSYAQQAAVFFVLLIVCANVANLMLAQASARRQESALRAALGAGRMRLVRQFLTESTILALAAGVVGTILALWGIEWVKSIVLVPIPYWLHFELDQTALVFSLGIALAAGILFGLVPALRGSGGELNDALKAGGGRSGDASSGNRLRNLLVVSQFAMSLILLVGALLMIKSFVKLQEVDVGYNTDQVLTMRLSLTGETYRGEGRRLQFLNEAVTRVTGLAGVEAAGVVNYLPASRGGYEVAYFEVEGRVSPPGEERSASYHTISTTYLETLEISVITGRAFTPNEVIRGGEVVLLSEGLAEELWPGQDPLGQRIRIVEGEPGSWLTVVGIVSDVAPAYQIAGLDDWPKEQLYVPYGRDPEPMVMLAVRTSSHPGQVTPAVREQLRALDPTVPVFDIFTMGRLLDVIQWVPRLWTQQFSLFAAIALFIAAMGVYGVTAYSVSRRTREMGIRIALGAQPREILGLVIRQALVLGIVGVVVGLAGALPMSRLLSRLLYGVSANDPVVFGGVALLLAVVSVLSGYWPARRAARVDPVVALRTE